jgi:hypothetical protein
MRAVLILMCLALLGACGASVHAAVDGLALLDLHASCTPTDCVLVWNPQAPPPSGINDTVPDGTAGVCWSTGCGGGTWIATSGRDGSNTSLGPSFER